MSYIKFEKNQIVNLEYSCPGRLSEPTGQVHILPLPLSDAIQGNIMAFLFVRSMHLAVTGMYLLSSLDVTVVNNDRSFNIGIRKYKGDYYSPKGHKYIEEFDMDGIPSMIYRVGGVKLKHERILVHYEEQYLVRFTILEASEPMKLQISPFLAFRNIHELTHANLDANTKVEFINNGIKIKLYEGFPCLHMQFSAKAEFIPVPDWYLGVEYTEEQKRGYDYSEDLFTPGFFEVDAKEGDVIVFSASTKEEKPSGFKAKFTKTVSGKIPGSNFINCLKNAAQQFIEKRRQNSYNCRLSMVRCLGKRHIHLASGTCPGTPGKKASLYRMFSIPR